MKYARAIVTYAVIGLLSAAALGGCLLSGNNKPAESVVPVASSHAAPALSAIPAATSHAAAQSASPAGTATPEATDIDYGQHALDVMKRSSEMPSSHLVAIAQGTDWETVTKQIVETAGGLKGIVKPGDIVILKPNLIRGRSAGSPVCTDWRVMQGLADIVKDCGAARIIIAEASPAGNAFREAEYDKITGVELLDMNTCKAEDCYRLKPDRSLTGEALFIPKIYMDADVVIGAAKLKTHCEPDAVVTLGLKLSMGVPPSVLYWAAGGKGLLHQLGLKETIVDLNRIRRPDFVVIDGIIGGEGFGPMNVTPVQSNIMFAGTDLVALDTVALTFMGFTVDEVPHVKLASDEGLGISDLSMITVVGADLEKIKMRFRRAFE